MISTIITTTTSTISSVTALVSFGATIGIVAVVTLAGFLCTKELITAGRGSTQRILARSLDVAIVPLVIAFIFIVAVKVVDILA